MNVTMSSLVVTDAPTCLQSQTRSSRRQLLCSSRRGSPCRPFTYSRSPAGRCRRVAPTPQAALDGFTLLAVTQQSLAFVAVAAGETFYTRSQLPEGTAGRPAVATFAASAAGIALGLLLLRTGEFGEKPGLILGAVTSAGLLLTYVKRANDTRGDPSEWPGPKVWPAGMALFSFFALNIFLGALQKS